MTWMDQWYIMVYNSIQFVVKAQLITVRLCAEAHLDPVISDCPQIVMTHSKQCRRDRVDVLGVI